MNFICVCSVKIDREMPVKNPRWPPRNLVFFYIWTSDRGDFPRIIVIALFSFIFSKVCPDGIDIRCIIIIALWFKVSICYLGLLLKCKRKLKYILLTILWIIESFVDNCCRYFNFVIIINPREKFFFFRYYLSSTGCMYVCGCVCVSLLLQPHRST